MISTFCYISMYSYFMKFKKNNYFSSQKLHGIRASYSWSIFSHDKNGDDRCNKKLYSFYKLILEHPICCFDIEWRLFLPKFQSATHSSQAQREELSQMSTIDEIGDWWKREIRAPDRLSDTTYSKWFILEKMALWKFPCHCVAHQFYGVGN